MLAPRELYHFVPRPVKLCHGNVLGRTSQGCRVVLVERDPGAACHATCGVFQPIMCWNILGESSARQSEVYHGFFACSRITESELLKRQFDPAPTTKVRQSSQDADLDKKKATCNPHTTWDKKNPN